MQTPIGYPPPTLARRRRFGRRQVLLILLLALFAALILGAIVFYWLSGAPPAVPNGERRTGAARVAARAAVPAPVPVDPVTIEAPAQLPIAERPIDGRQANQWYYVERLGDGPAAIYSRTGGEWSYAFACTPQTGMIEFIAVGIGSPGDFDRQSIRVGKVRLMLEAGYSREGGGTITSHLRATHPFFNALDGNAPMEIQLVATRKAIVPVGPTVVHLIRTCRGRG